MRFLKKCYRIHKTGQNKKRRHKTITRNFWNTRSEIQTQTKLDQPPRKSGQHQTAETRPHLQTQKKKGSRTPQEKMVPRWCRKRSNALIHGGRWWWLLLLLVVKCCHVSFDHETGVGNKMDAQSIYLVLWNPFFFIMLYKWFVTILY